MEHLEAIKEFGGWLNRYRHDSATCRCAMTFSVYLPPQAATAKVPAVYWLSGLTCTDDNFRVKAGAQRYAAELGLALVIPDTSPRGVEVPMCRNATISAKVLVSTSTPPSHHGRSIIRCTITSPANCRHWLNRNCR